MRFTPASFGSLNGVPVQAQRLLAQDVRGDEEYLLRAVEGLGQTRWLGEAGLADTNSLSRKIRGLLRIADTDSDLRCRHAGQQPFDNPAPIVPCCSRDHDHASLPPVCFQR
jgi:hypothetical protein